MSPASPPANDIPCLRVGVVGAGVFGGYHAAKCAAHPRVDLVGIHDPNSERAEALADRDGVKAFAELELMLAAVDAVIVACPATGHYAAAKAALLADKDVLVEKPIAHTVAHAEELVALAAERGRILQVGHQERFVAKAIGLDHIDEPPTAIRAWRHSGYSPRGTDVSVALDLMTHDIDLVLWLMNGDPEAVAGESEVVRSSTPDRAEATLSFPTTTAWLSASRVAEMPRRELELVYPSGTIAVDFAAKTLTNSSEHPVVASFADDPGASDSLGAATDAFVRAVLDGAPVPITGGMGLRALRYALEATEEG